MEINAKIEEKLPKFYSIANPNGFVLCDWWVEFYFGGEKIRTPCANHAVARSLAEYLDREGYPSSLWTGRLPG